jgi:hypothetical protein
MKEQKISDFLCGSAEQRLKVALELIGVEDKDPKHHRHNIISQIMLYAGSKGDSNLERVCEKSLETIKTE